MPDSVAWFHLMFCIICQTKYMSLYSSINVIWTFILTNNCSISTVSPGNLQRNSIASPCLKDTNDHQFIHVSITCLSLFILFQVLYSLTNCDITECSCSQEMRDRSCSCSSRHKRVLFHNFFSRRCRLVVWLARARVDTHTGAADAVHASHKTNASSIAEKAARNQMGLTAANTMTINCMKYSRLANVNWRCVWAARTWGSEVVNLCFKHHHLTTKGPFRHIRPDLFAKPWICLGRSHGFLLSPGTCAMIWFVLRPLGPGERERQRKRQEPKVQYVKILRKPSIQGRPPDIAFRIECTVGRLP